MSVQSPENLMNDVTRDVSFMAKDVPRKRSKVSRACDSCRRKKIRCNAEYSSSLSRVTKVCTNCTKTGETCLFSRVPMKRGPSKGYIRDLVDHLDGSENGDGRSNRNGTASNRPRSKSIDTAGLKYFFSGSKRESSQITSPLPASQHLNKPHFDHPMKFPTSSANQPIILPPLIGPQPSTQPVKLSLPIPMYSASVSPRSGGAPLPNLPNSIPHSISGDNPSHRIQGPLWKVPYEMPTSNTPRSEISSPGGSNNLSFDSRRSSVDSVSSVSTAGSGSILPSLYHTASIKSNSVLYTSDSDDSSGCSDMPSPRNSISSLSSLNGKIANNLIIARPDSLPPQNNQGKLATFAHASHQSQHQYFSNLSHLQITHNRIPQVGYQQTSSEVPRLENPHFQPSSPSMKRSLDHNLKLYYTNFHDGFPILPFDDLVVPKMVSELQTSCPADVQVVDLFAISLGNLIDYQLISFDAIRGSLLHFTSIYPFGDFTSPCRNEVLCLAFASLLLINYTILLRGDSCPTGISLAHGAFTEFKVLQNFKSLTLERVKELDRDNIQLYLPRLQVCLLLIDKCHALSWGTQSQNSKFSTLSSITSVSSFFDKSFCSEFLENVELGKLFETLEDMKSEEFFCNKPRGKRGSFVSSLNRHFTESNLARCIFCLQNDKYELFDFASEVIDFFNTHSNIDCLDDYTKDHIHDYQLKTSRLVKKVSQSILRFANHVSGDAFQSKFSIATGEAHQVSPFLNIIYGQSFRLIKISKVLLDSLVEHAGDNEISSRSMKILNELSTATNLLIVNLKKNLTDIENCQYMRTSDSALVSRWSLISRGPGVSAIQANFRKLEIFGLNSKSPMSAQLSIGEQKSFDAWRNDFLKTSSSLIFCENLDGWI